MIGFVTHSGAVLLVIVFLTIAIGATLLMSTAGRTSAEETGDRRSRNR